MLSSNLLASTWLNDPPITGFCIKFFFASLKGILKGVPYCKGPLFFFHLMLYIPSHDYASHLPQ